MKDTEHHDKMAPMSRPTTRLALNALVALLATCVVDAADLQGNADKGKELFTANGCTACHSVTSQDAAKLGPLLVGVVGRKAGTTKSLLGPTENLTKYGVIWSAETLNEFLANPDAKAPGTPMAGMIVDAQQRADVIAYLSTLK